MRLIHLRLKLQELKVVPAHPTSNGGSGGWRVMGPQPSSGYCL